MQIYESVIVDRTGTVTTGLLHGVRYVKDNRLLPAGFDKSTAEPDIAVHGRANTDVNFVEGGDRVRYSVDLSGARGTFTLEAILWYQSIGYRWAENYGRTTLQNPGVLSLTTHPWPRSPESSWHRIRSHLMSPDRELAAEIGGGMASSSTSEPDSAAIKPCPRLLVLVRVGFEFCC